MSPPGNKLSKNSADFMMLMSMSTRGLRTVADTLQAGDSINQPHVIVNVVDWLAAMPNSDEAFAFREKALDFMLEAGMNANTRSSTGFSLLCNVFSTQDHDDVAVQIMSRSKVPLDFTALDYEEWSPICYAGYNSRLETLQCMQDHFEQHVLPQSPHLPRNHLWTDLSCGRQKQNALMTAAHRPEAVRWMLGHPALSLIAHLEDKDANGKSALRLAVECTCLDSVRALLSVGASTKSVDLDGKSVLEEAFDCFKNKNDGSPQAPKTNVFRAIKAAHDADTASRSIDDVIKNSMSRAAP